jgi:hypothetical protein
LQGGGNACFDLSEHVRKVHISGRHLHPKTIKQTQKADQHLGERSEKEKERFSEEDEWVK